MDTTRTPAPPPPDYRRLMADRLRCIIAGPEWTGQLELGEAEAIVTDLLDTAGLLPLLTERLRHVIEFGPTGWWMQHPLSCRPEMLSCPVHQVAMVELSSAGHLPPGGLGGRFEVAVNDLGDRLVIGDRVDDPAEQPGGTS